MTEKESSFKKIATRRTQNILDNIRLLSNCSNTNNYSFTEKDINKIFRSIDDELKTCKAMFRKNNKKKEFKL